MVLRIIGAAGKRLPVPHDLEPVPEAYRRLGAMRDSIRPRQRRDVERRAVIDEPSIFARAKSRCVILKSTPPP